MAASLQHEVFAQHLNTIFRIYVDDSSAIDAKLIEVSELNLSPRQERFSIVFRGPNETYLGQGMRRFEHPEMGEFALFLVPISSDDQGYRYESVFNRLVKT